MLDLTEEQAAESEYRLVTQTSQTSGFVVDVHPSETEGVALEPPPASTPGDEIDVTAAICGPEITQGLLDALTRIRDRVRDEVSDADKGWSDGTFFLERNGVNIDYQMNCSTNSMGESICPTDACKAPDGQTTVMLCGHCIMEHNANDIMFGFVSNQLGVPYLVQNLGAEWAQYNSYGGFEPIESKASYCMGNDVSEALGDETDTLDVEAFCALLEETETEIASFPVDPDVGNAFDFLVKEQAFLKDCQPPPAYCTRPGGKDFSTTNWNLSD
jgi:hypothetical protein